MLFAHFVNYVLILAWLTRGGLVVKWICSLNYGGELGFRFEWIGFIYCYVGIALSPGTTVQRKINAKNLEAAQQAEANSVLPQFAFAA